MPSTPGRCGIACCRACGSRPKGGAQREHRQTFFDFASEVGLTKRYGGLEGTEGLLALCLITDSTYLVDVGWQHTRQSRPTGQRSRIDGGRCRRHRPLPAWRRPAQSPVRLGGWLCRGRLPWRSSGAPPRGLRVAWARAAWAPGGRAALAHPRTPSALGTPAANIIPLSHCPNCPGVPSVANRWDNETTKQRNNSLSPARANQSPRFCGRSPRSANRLAVWDGV
jgi:hypothetical protein